MSKAQQQELKLTPKYLFEKQTIAELAQVAKDSVIEIIDTATISRFETHKNKLAVPSENIDDIYPLAPMQQGMLFHSLYEEGNTDYVNQIQVDVNNLDSTTFKKAWNTVIARHDISRTGFISDSDEPLQWVAKQVDLPWLEEDWREKPEKEVALARLKEKELNSIDLINPPLMRVALVQVDENTHHLIWTTHHILLDGWSAFKFMGEILTIYMGGELQPVKTDYKHYIAWLNQQNNAHSETYWKEVLSAIESPTYLFADLELTTQTKKRTTDIVSYTVAEEVYTDILSICRKNRITVNTFVQGVWSILLSKHSNQETVCFGATVSGRPSSLNHVEDMIGLFINSLPIVASINSQQRILYFLHTLQENNLTHRLHEHIPLGDIQNIAGFQGQGLFDTLVVFENFPVDAAFKETSSSNTQFEIVNSHETTSNPLVIRVTDKDQLKFECIYDTRIDRNSIEQVVGQIQHLLEQCVQNVDKPIHRLQLVKPEEQSQIIEQGTNKTLPVNSKHVHMLMSEQANIQPNRIAVSDKDKAYLYKDLEQYSNKIAHYLIAEGVKVEDRIGIYIDRSINMVLGLISILKAGATYVPIDPALPKERVDYIIKDSKITTIITQSNFIQDLTISSNVSLLDIDTLLNDEKIMMQDTNVPEINIQPSNSAYIIYTSGTTGQSKGVVINHESMSNYVQGIIPLFPKQADSLKMAMVSTVAADLGNTVLFGALTTANTLLMVDHNVISDPNLFAEYMNDNKIDILKIVPSHFNGLLSANNPSWSVPNKRLILGGEATSITLVDKIKKLKPECQVINHYGPTESTVGVIVNTDVHMQSQSNSDNLAIGLPLSNSSAFVLDQDLHLVPFGMSGELYIGGTGLARGYLNKVGLTSTHFIANPFSNKGDRLYRTGDLVRWNTDGQIEYLDRIDYQVKIRGYRVELGEIENALNAEEFIKQSVVIAQKQDQSSRLVAYVVLDSNYKLDTQVIQTSLQEQLPEYMVPSIYVELESIPLNANGKIDRKMLPEPEMSSAESYEAPEGDIETKLAQIWQDVLKVDKVGRNDNFFELGGDSIISLQIVSRARKQGLKISPRDLFEKQSLSELATSVKSIEKVSKPIAVNNKDKDIPLLPVQKEFFSLEVFNYAHYNQALMFEVEIIDQARLTEALKAVILNHDGLRLAYKKNTTTGNYQQNYSAYNEQMVESSIWYKKVDNELQITEISNEAQQSLVLDSGLLLRTVIMETATNYRILFIAHHLVIDGVSWRILIEDIMSAYQQIELGNEIALTKPESSYQDWSESLKNEGVSYFKDELNYWKGLDATVNIQPYDNEKASCKVKDSQNVSFTLDEDYTHRLLKKAPSAYRTQVNDLLLSALGQVLTTWSGSDSMLIDLEGHGREDIFNNIDLSSTTGWFTSIFPVQLNRYDSLIDSIQLTKEALRNVPSKGLGFGVLKNYGNFNHKQRLNKIPKRHVVFNYLGQVGSIEENPLDWQLANENSGYSIDPDMTRKYELAVNSIVQNNKLTVNIGYSQNYSENAMSKLVNEYEATLKAVIDFCCSDVYGLTPSDVSLSELSQEQLDSLPISAEFIDDIYPLSPMQQGMLFHSLYEEDETTYVNQIRLDIRNLDTQKFHQAWKKVIQRHDILRTGFMTNVDKPLQWVAKQVDLPWLEDDYCNNIDIKSKLNSLALTESKSIDLLTPPLFRIALILTDESQGQSTHHLIWSKHHLLSDGWSTAKIMSEVFALYSDQQLVSAQGSYKDYIEWLSQQDDQASNTYWKDIIAQLNEPSYMTNHLPNMSSGVVKNNSSFVLPGCLKEQMTRLAQHAHITTNTIIQGVWSVLLSKYTNQEMVCFGATVSGRPEDLADVENIVGLFINTLPIVVEVNSNKPVTQWLKEIQSQNVSSREYGYTPLHNIQRLGGYQGQGIFDTLIVFENYPIDTALETGNNKEIEFFNIESMDETNYPITLTIVENEYKTNIECTYDGQIKDTAIEQLLAQMQYLLEQIVEDIEQPLSNLTLIKQDEAIKLIAQSVNPESYEYSKSVHELISEQAKQTPHAIAIINEQGTLTYQELETQSNQLANLLIKQGISIEDRVGIYVQRSPNMVVGLLGILKAGATYIPIDPSLPKARIDYMIEDSGLKTIVTQKQLADDLSQHNDILIVCIEESNTEQSTQPNVVINQENSAYIIYTSGTTGNPKGVVIAHGSLCNFLNSMKKTPGMTKKDTLLAVTSLSFDIAGLELYLPLILGAQLYVATKEDVLDGDKLGEIINQHDISIMQATPSGWRVLLDSNWKNDNNTSLKALCGGEAVPHELVERLQQNNVELWNMYGPTETTIWSTTQNLNTEDISIGNSIDSTETYILDSNVNLVAKGMTGELYLGGKGLARGYLNRSGLTSERFIANPFSDKGERLYRTGDLVRWNEDGQLEYLGRIDHQVKIRGYRIELGEIESVINNQVAIKQSVVVAQEQENSSRLIGYIVKENNDEVLDEQTLQVTLKEQLPDYMVPSIYVELESIPLNSNGKVDRKALPKPEMMSSVSYETPQGEVEEKLAKIWQEVLKVEKVGRHDNFFELGGDSIISLQIVSKAKKEGLQVTPREIFEKQSLRELAEASITDNHTEALDLSEISKLEDYKDDLGDIFNDM